MYGDYLAHYGVKGMRWGVRKKYPEKLSINKGDHKLTQRAKRDYNNLSDRDFMRKYSASKKQYAKRVAKSSIGDPYRDRLNKVNKGGKIRKSLHKMRVKSEVQTRQLQNRDKKARAYESELSTLGKVGWNLWSGVGAHVAYGQARASGYTKTGAKVMLASMGTRSTTAYSDSKYLSEHAHVTKRMMKEYE